MGRIRGLGSVGHRNQVVTVKVVNGRRSVHLVPSTNSSPPAFYSVTYNSDGRVQFNETWAVPASASPLRLRDVRVPALNLTASDTASGPIPESQVTGLVADLSSRPVKGPASRRQTAWSRPRCILLHTQTRFRAGRGGHLEISRGRSIR
jgi:hypothetical protein